MASQPPTSPLTAYATRIAHDQINPGFVKHLQTLAKADPTFQDRLNAEVARITKGIEAKQNSGPLAIAGQTIEGIGNPLEWLKGAVEGAPQVVKGIGKAAGGNVGGGLKQAGMGAVGVAGILPVGRLGKILTAAKDARTAEEAASHIEEASKNALAEGHGAHGAGGRGQAPKVQPGEITPETGGELGSTVRGALKGKRAEPYVSHSNEAVGGALDQATIGQRGYVYHRAPVAAFKSIATNGLKASKPTSDLHGVYFATNPLTTAKFAGKGAANSIFVRAREADIPGIALHPNKAYGEMISPNDVPPSALEYLGSDGAWHPVETQSANQARAVQAEIQSAARGQQVAKGLAAREKAGGGLAGHLAERAAQRGDLPTVYFDNALRNLDQGTFEQMIRHVQDLPTLKPFEQGKAVDALTKLAEGKVPAKHEQVILERAFGKETSDSLRLIANSKGDVVRNILNVPRALMSTLDFSAPFRQGLVTLFHNPKVFGKAFVPMFKAWLSEDYFQKNIMDAITSRPTYPLMDKAGVPFTDIGRDAKGGVSNLNSREEAFMSNYAERLPLGIGKVVRASDRAYVGFLDLIRADSFDKLAHGFAEQGYDLNDKELLRSMGDFIGAATGRGNLPALQAHTATLNALLFSPRLMMSRLNFLGFGGEGLKSLVPGSYYMSLHPAVRVEAWKSLIRLGVTATMILKMANMGGLDVVADPTNADFGKLKVGNTRFDILGGFQQYIRLGAELAERKVTSSTTGKVMPLSAGVGKTSISDILKHFFEGKLSPVPSALATAADQEDFTGAKVSLRNPKTLGKQVVQRVTPFMAQDIYEALTTPGVPKAVKIGGPFADVFGIGMQSYAPKLPKVSGGSTGGGFDFGGGSSGFDGGFGSNSDGGFGG